MTFLDIKLAAIGYVKNEAKEVSIPLKNNDLHFDAGLHSQINFKASTSEIVVEKEFEECLDGLEDFSHIIVIFLTNVPEDARKTIKKIHPGGIKEAPLKGIFSSRSPIRPNPLAMSTVRLLEKGKNRLVVEGFDAVDGTTILDIKPFIALSDAPDNPKTAQWVFELEELFHKKIDEKG